MTLFLVLLVACGIALFTYVAVAAGYGALFGEARRALDRGETAEAIRLLERLVRRYPDHAAAHHLLGVAHRRRGETAAARRHLEAAVRKPTPDVPLADAFALLSDVLADLGESAGAYAAMREAVAAAPANGRLLVRLSERAATAGETAAALDSVERALALPGADRGLQKIRGTYLKSLGRADDALAAFREAVAAAPDDGETHLLFGEALETKGDLDAAEVSFRTAAQHLTGPQAARAHLRIGALRERRSDLDGALASYRTSLGASPEGEGRKEALWRLGEVHLRRGERMDAVSFYEQLYRIEPAFTGLVDRLRIAPGVLSDGDVLTTIHALSVLEFQSLVTRILARSNQAVESIKVKDTTAIDAVTKSEEDDRERRRIVHVRRWTNDVGQLPLQELHLAVLEGEFEGGLFFSTANLSPAAFRFIQTVKVIEVVSGQTFLHRVREVGFE